LNSGSAEFQRTVALAIAEIGPPALPALTLACEDPNRNVRGGAAFALGEIGRPAEIAWPHLTRLLTDPAPEVRVEAERALRKIAQEGEFSEGNTRR